MPTKHARYGPSTLKSRQICPGYMSSDKTSEASLQGTRLHSYCEFDGDVKKAKAAFEKENKPEKWSLTPEEQEWGDMALEYVRGLHSKGIVIHKEVELDLTKLKVPGVEKGTADWLGFPKIDPLLAILVDYKFGWGDIDPVEKNIQFRTYAAGVFLMYPKIQRVEVHMVQPKQNVADSCVFARTELELIQTTVGAIVKRVDLYEETKDKAMLNASNETTCGYCERQAICPLWQDTAVAMMNLADQYDPEDSKDKIPSSLIPEELDITSVEDADPVVLAGMLRCLGPLDHFIRKLKAFALEVHESGAELPGYNVSSSSGKSEIIGTLDAMEIIKEEFGITDEEFISTCSTSLTSLKALVGTKSEKGKKGADSDRLVALLDEEGLISRGGGYSYLRASSSKIVDD